jgi:Pyruvate/2-oxoacid:ferredoxin oxidoreductase gamma subunit
VAFCQSSADAYAPMVRADGVFVYDSENVTEVPCSAGVTYGIPFSRLAQEAAGRGEPVPDLFALGAVIAITGVVSAGSLEKTMDEIVLPGSKEAMTRGLSSGLKMDVKQWQRGPECS